MRSPWKRPTPTLSLAHRAQPLTLALALVGLWACGPPGGSEAGAPAPEPGKGTLAARVDGQTIDLATLDAWIRDDLFRRATEDGDAMKTWSVRRDGLVRMIDEQLLEEEAERTGTSVREMVTQEMERRLAVTDAEVDAFYAENEDRIGRPLEDVGEQVRRHLESQAAPAARDAYLVSLRAAHTVEIVLDAPRVEVDATGPALGPTEAPVTIVAFTDYQCPFCRRAEPTVAKLRERYPDQLRIVYRHFPLDRIHPLARSAAEAAACADDQGRFWDYHARLFSEGAQLETAGLEAFASDLGLDLEIFRQCALERRHQALVEADLAAGRAAGVKGTPAFFVNGIRLNGARPLEDFVEVIDDELGRAS